MAQPAKLTLVQNSKAHQGSVTSISIGPRTGVVFATGGEDKVFSLWAVGKSQPLTNFDGLSSFVTTSRFVNTEDMIMAGNNGGSVLFYDCNASKLAASWSVHRSKVNCIAFDPTNQQNFATCGHDGVIRILAQKCHSPITSLNTGRSPLNCIAYSHDGKYLASCGDDNTVRIYDLASNGILAYFESNQSAVKSVEFHPTKNLIVTGGADRSIRFYSLDTFTELEPAVPLNTSEVVAVRFNNKSNVAFGASNDMLSVVGYDPCESFDRMQYSVGKVHDMQVIENNIIIASSMREHAIINRVKTTLLSPFSPYTTSKKVNHRGSSADSYVKMKNKKKSNISNSPDVPLRKGAFLEASEKEIYQEFKRGRAPFRTEMAERYSRIKRLEDMIENGSLSAAIEQVASGGDLQLELASVVLRRPKSLKMEDAPSLLLVASRLFETNSLSALSLVDCVLNEFGKTSYATMRTAPKDIAIMQRRALSEELIDAFRNCVPEIRAIAEERGPLQKTASDILDKWRSLT